jgi:Uma2 family endonuclease
MRLLGYLIATFGTDRLQTQATMEVADEDRITNRPEPDAVVLSDDPRRNPTGGDVLLVVEVSDTTAADDFGVKVGLYARASVAEYWIVDLNRRRLVTYRDPADGAYRAHPEFYAGDAVAPLCAPDSPVAVADLLPPADFPR